MKKIKSKINKRYILSILLLVAIVLIARSFGKYVIEKKDTHVQESSGFYFESEIADTGEGKEYAINNWDGNDTNNIDFGIRNFTNSLLNTKDDIIFKIAASAKKNAELVNVKIYDSSDNEILQNQELKITGKDNNESKYQLRIEPKESIEEGKEIDVELTIFSSNPYTKELKSSIKFIVKKNKNYEASLINSINGEYVTLNVKAISPDKDLKIEYDNSKLVLDSSSNLTNDVSITTNGQTNSFTISKEKLEQNCNYEIIFIKTDTNDEIVLGTDISLEN